MSLKMAKKVPKMDLKWPQNGPAWAPWQAILGPVWAFFGFSGRLGLLDVILDQYAAVPATRINVPSNVEI